jgi:predicted branched-subunit amino acid permease
MLKTQQQDTEPYWSAAGWWIGLRLSLPILASMVLFGLAVGAAGARAGLSFIDNLLMNVLVFAGVSQMVAFEIWPQVFTWDAVATLTLITAVVNSRMFLASASMHVWLARVPAWQSVPLLYYLTDTSWLVSMRYRADGGRDLAVCASATFLVVMVWLVTVVAGYVLGARVGNPRIYGLDLVMPVFFVVMLVPLWNGRRRAIGWGVAGLVALVSERLLPGWWFIIIGAVTGAVVGGLLEGRRQASA